ncbi:MAG: tRNA pseudouridine(38-40) synthase TruA [Bacteroidia bacterium]|nr:tRNA pseudouridine(38-40) synthase TruA [Bacteroidia bacterium]
MNNRYFIELSFHGGAYGGWQIQPNKISVQQVLNSALSVLFKIPVMTTGAGRTDAGVHARFFVAHFDAPAREINENLVYQLNGILPKDIAVKKIFAVKNNAHSRFDALSRTYEYIICTTKDPFYRGLACFIYRNLDQEAMNAAAAMLGEYDDFTSFSKLHTNQNTNICKIYHAGWISNGSLLVFSITADRFLRNMVRAITGTMIDIGKRKIKPENIRTIIESKNRSAAGISVPAEGLYLVNIEYPADLIVSM